MNHDVHQLLDTAKNSKSPTNHSSSSVNGVIKYDRQPRTTGTLRQSSIEPWVQTEARTQKQMFDTALNSFGNLNLVDKDMPSANSEPLRSIPKGGTSISRNPSRRVRRHARAEANIQANRRGGDRYRPSYHDERRGMKREVRIHNGSKSYYPSDIHSGTPSLGHRRTDGPCDTIANPRKLSRAAKAKVNFARKLEIENLVGCVRASGQSAICPNDIRAVKAQQAARSWATPEEQLGILRRNYEEAQLLLTLAHDKADSGHYGPCRRVVDVARQFWVAKLVALARADGTLSEEEIDDVMDKFPAKGFQAMKDRKERKKMRQLMTSLEALWFGSNFSRSTDNF